MNITIIGAGPAGSLAGLLLARAGWTVDLIEQHRFPRDKVCGECLSALGIAVLHRAGLGDTLRRLSPALLRKTTFVSTDGVEKTIPLPRPMWGLSRAKMDESLLREAMAVGVRVRQPARCEDVQTEPLRLAMRDLETNQIAHLQPDLLLVADGKGAFVADKPTSTGDLGVKAHFAGVKDVADAITLFGLRSHYVGLAPIEGNLWNLAMSVPASKVKCFGGDLDALFQEILRENSGLAARMRRATRVGEWLASPLPRFAVRSRWPKRVIPIGNAAVALEPIGGEGMGLGLRSAEIVVEEVLARGRDYNADLLRKKMKRLWNVRRAACRAGGVLLSKPRVAKAVTRLGWPLASLALRVAGK